MKQVSNLGLPLKIATGIYLFCSLLGLPLYMILPPVFASLGARLHAYLHLIKTFIDSEPTPLLLVLIVVSYIFLLALIIAGILAIWKGRYRIYTILVTVEIVLTFILLYSLDVGISGFAAGILINVAYCIWLLWAVFVKKPHDDTAKSFRKEN
jgi:hypothetical protein